MEPTNTTPAPTSSNVSQGTNPQQIDTGNVDVPRIGKKRNSSIMSATSPPSSSSKLQADEDLGGTGSTRMDAILTAGLREKRNSHDTSPKSSEEKHTDNYSVSTGNNSQDSVDQGDTINGQMRPQLASVQSSSSSASSSTHPSTLEPLVHITAPLGVPIQLGRLTTSTLRGAQKDYHPTTKPNNNQFSPQSSNGRLPMARGSPVRRLSGALNQSGKGGKGKGGGGGLNMSGKSVGMLGMSGKTVSIRGSFNSAYGDPTTPHHTTRDKTHGIGGGGGGNKDHRRHGALRYDRFWDGVHAMIDIQNSTKLQHEITKSDTKKHLSDFDRLR